MMSEHTLEHWPQELYLPGPMIDRTNWDQWRLDGEKGFRERAADVIDECISNYDLEPLEDKMHAEIRNLFERTANDKDVRLPAFE